MRRNVASVASPSVASGTAAIVLLGVLAGCEAKRDKPAPEPASAPAVAHVPADALIDAPGLPLRAVKLASVGKVDRGNGVRGLSIVGDYVYWSTITDDTQITSWRRVARTGGAVEELGSASSVAAVHHDLDLAVIGDDVYAAAFTTDTSRPRTAWRAPLVQLKAGKAKVIAQGPPGTLASSNLIAHEGKLYWVAQTSMGPGPVVVTDPRSGATTVVAACVTAAVDGCPELLAGTPPIVAGKRMKRLGATPGEIKGQCPACTIASRVLGEHLLCVPGPSDRACSPTTAIVKLDGSEMIEAKDIDDARRGGGFFYHHGDALSLQRRKTFDGADDHVAPRADTFAVDDAGVAWIDVDTLWAAPH